MANKAKVVETKVITGKVRFGFENVFSPRKNDDGTDGKYDLVILIDKDDTDNINAIKKAIEAATQKGLKEIWGGKMPKNFQNPLKDGDDKDEEYEDVFGGKYYINAKSKHKPGIVDLARKEITEESGEFYAGCYGYASITFYPFDNQSKGVGVALNNIMKSADGEHLGGKASAESDFADIEDDNDDL